MLNIACMSYSEKLLDIAKSIPFERDLISGTSNVDGLEARAKVFWDLAVKIVRYMEERNNEGI